MVGWLRYGRTVFLKRALLENEKSIFPLCLDLDKAFLRRPPKL
jgi:hypothetical protein